MRVLISGSSGLVGLALATRLRRRGDDVVRLVRSTDTPDDAVAWDPAHGRLDPRQLESFDTVVHLAGENIAGGRWTTARMQRIRDSRVVGTRLLAERLLETGHRPGVFVQASAIGYYGDRGDEKLDESSAAGSGFLADVCREWEDASRPLASAGVRVVLLRIGVVLSSDGGALPKMALPFRLGLGGVIGSGAQFTSWITLDDLCAVIEFAIARGDLAGPVHAVAPEPVTNREFTAALGKVLRRPTLVPLPAFAARLLLGRMADELLLASARVVPAKLSAAGFTWRHANLEAALRAQLGTGGDG